MFFIGAGNSTTSVGGVDNGLVNALKRSGVGVMKALANLLTEFIF